MNLGKDFTLSPVIKEIIDHNSSGQRIDNFLIKRLKGIRKDHIYRFMRSGQVRVNSKRINADYRLKEGDTVRIPPVKVIKDAPVVARILTKSRFISFEILFQDEALMVINKPAGIAVHGGSGVSFGVIEQLRAQYPNWKFIELVHRLDRETSGILLLAKKRGALVELHRQIREGKIEKRYLVMVKGNWPNIRQNVRFSLNKYVTTTGERRVAVVTDKTGNKKGVTAHTLITLQKSWQDFSLLEAELKTGRTHQIRVHLAHLGFPIAGDAKYGDFSLNKQLAGRNSKMPNLKRMFLHAAVTIITHPETGESLRLEAPLADDLQRFLDRLNTRSIN
ncbi:pseudouridine synthase [Nitrosomonadaceae bacterium]|nr:pseudouridine synthase [Nitrosomonadaceae bacterium]